MIYYPYVTQSVLQILRGISQYYQETLKIQHEILFFQIV